MEIKRFLRITMVILVVVMLTVSLSACRLPSSTGPEGETAEESPAAGEVDQGDEIAAAATASAQAPAGGATEGGTSGGDTGSQPLVMTETPAPIPPTNTPVPYVQPTPGIPTSYVLKYGEFPFCIARRFDVNQYELLSINGLGVNSATYVGMTLKIPQTGNHFDGQVWLKAHPADYKVKAGDTLEIIACKFGNVSPELIALQNNLTAPFTLSVGQKLVIP